MTALMLSIAFWIAAAIITYAYFGYFFWLRTRKIWRPWPVLRGVKTPTVSVVMVVCNEAAMLPEKLSNLLALDYPAESLQLVLVSDGSTDNTEAILREAARDPRVQVVLNQLSQGKACGLNDGVANAQGEVIVFTDARQRIEEQALRLLMENFADPQVGAVSGELMLGDPARGESNRGMGLYWRMEKRVRELESATGSVVGATGSFYAVRRELVQEVPAETILDDVFIPMHVARRGYRVIFDERARAWDVADLGSSREFQRKVRTLSGNYQVVQLAPWLPRRENPLRFEFVSHKLIRLVVPFALLAMFMASCFLWGRFYRIAFWVQVCGYGLSLLGWSGWNLGPLARLADACRTAVILNAAALIAFSNFVMGRKVDWVQASSASLSATPSSSSPAASSSSSTAPSSSSLPSSSSSSSSSEGKRKGMRA
jgi:biofilm PGA synthesis N-glycosyltransferase PgaC